MGFCRHAVFGHRDKVNSVGFDPEGAKKLLAEAGFAGGKGIPQLTMYFRQDYPDIKIVATAVGQDLSKNLGVQVTFKQLEWGHYLDLHNKNQLPFFHMRWGADYLDAENFLSTLLRLLWTGEPRCLSQSAVRQPVRTGRHIHGRSGAYEAVWPSGRYRAPGRPVYSDLLPEGRRVDQPAG